MCVIIVKTNSNSVTTRFHYSVTTSNYCFKLKNFIVKENHGGLSDF